MNRTVLVLVSWIAACASTPRGTPEGSAIPAQWAPQVERAERIGRLMLQNDVVSARATDVLMDAKVLGNDPALRGWITFPAEDGGWTVQFISEGPAGLGAGYELTFERDSPREANVERFSPPRPLDPTVAAMFRARGTALQKLAGTPMCGTGINPLVLPASLIGKDGWLVYLLASSHRAEDIVLAGHKLFRISEDGGRVEEEVALSRSCLIQQRAAAKPDEAPMHLVTHALHPHPIETHVFTSLLYATDLYVGTMDARKAWAVEKGKVRLVGDF